MSIPMRPKHVLRPGLSEPKTENRKPKTQERLVEVDADELAALRRDREWLREADRFWRMAFGHSLILELTVALRNRRVLGHHVADQVEAAAVAAFDQEEAAARAKTRPGV